MLYPLQHAPVSLKYDLFIYYSNRMNAMTTVWRLGGNSDIFTPPNTLSVLESPQLSVLHDQILHKIWKFCMKFGHLILRKIFKFVATRCQILRLKCTKFNFSWGSAPDPLQRSPNPLVGFKGPTCKGGKWMQNKRGEGWGAKKKGRKRREGDCCPLTRDITYNEQAKRVHWA